MSAAPLTLGTAGHIDHGKTALIRALTGVDTDRLPEERRRGISIALGYAALDLPSGRRLSVVDVPGHERFVKTMVAGATGIDLFLLTIAADDGVMPQTREHLAVLAGLGLDRGVVAVTKADAADPGRALDGARELLPSAPAIAVSARTGSGLSELLAALDAVIAEIPERPAAIASAPARLHVDRVFTVRGAGTVVTGTLWSGSVSVRDEVELLPGARRARVREVQVHDSAVERAPAGQRVALNLTGVHRDEVRPGDVVAGAGAGLVPAHIIDVVLEISPAARPPEHGDRVQIHHGTRESPARLVELGGRFWQLRLERPLLCATGDRIVVRRIAPPDTLGGGRVLDPAARRHGPSRDLLTSLARLERGEPAPPPAANDDFPDPSPPPTPDPAPPPLSALARAAEERLRGAGLEPPLDVELPPEEAAELPALRAAGRAVRVGPTMHFHADALAVARQRVVALARTCEAVTLADVRDDLGTSRKYAQALLEHFDSEKLTLRRGDARVLRRSRER